MNLEELREAIVQELYLDIAPELIGFEDDLIRHWNIDSFSLLGLVFLLEENLGVSFEESDFSIRNFRTIRNIWLVCEKLRSKQNG